MPTAAAPPTHDWNEVRAEVRARLGELPAPVLDAELWSGFSARLAGGRLGSASNRLTNVEPAGEGAVDSLAEFSAAELQAFRERGDAALRGGEVAAAVLNGGMATRFGGAVKGVVEAVDGRSFLEIKAEQARAFGAPLLVMNSFATHAPTLAHMAERGLSEGVHGFLQSVSVRLTAEGAPFREADGTLSLCAPGHGDFPGALRASGLLPELRAAGVRTLLLSNVDNLGAELDPVVVGYHLERERPLTCEVAPALGSDVGGAPALVDGELQVVEGFRFPEGYDASRNRWLSTNTFTMSLELLEREYDLTWFYVEKQVGGRVAVQMERLVNELSAFVPTGYLAAPRSLESGRFFPVKTREDLEALRGQPAFAARFGRR
jgi:UTP--glucose-1-phosphate uridylyltransferase